MRDAEILAELRVICAQHERATSLLDELFEIRREQITWSMPLSITNRLRSLFPERHTILAWEKRARHAHDVWWDKYGPFNDEQADYERELFDYVLSEGSKSRGKLHGLMEDLVNHESVDLGFKKRATVHTFSVQEVLSESAA